MKVEILYVPGCPNLEPTRTLVKKLLAQEDIQAAVEAVAVTDEATATSLGFAGSPTVLVNGRDIEPVTAAPRAGLNCRLYPDGEARGVPSRHSVRRAIRESASREGA